MGYTSFCASTSYFDCRSECSRDDAAYSCCVHRCCFDLVASGFAVRKVGTFVGIPTDETWCSCPDFGFDGRCGSVAEGCDSLPMLPIAITGVTGFTATDIGRFTFGEVLRDRGTSDPDIGVSFWSLSHLEVGSRDLLMHVLMVDNGLDLLVLRWMGMLRPRWTIVIGLVGLRPMLLDGILVCARGLMMLVMLGMYGCLMIGLVVKILDMEIWLLFTRFGLRRRYLDETTVDFDCGGVLVYY